MGFLKETSSVSGPLQLLRNASLQEFYVITEKGKDLNLTMLSKYNKKQIDAKKVQADQDVDFTRLRLQLRQGPRDRTRQGQVVKT